LCGRKRHRLGEFLVPGRSASHLLPKQSDPATIPVAMAPRPPSVDQGVQAFVWTLVFFLFMWLGAIALGFSSGTSLVVSLVVAGGVFLLVRTRGGDYPGPR
jgi:hypothetical protein